jgi:hypothetical protein
MYGNKISGLVKFGNLDQMNNYQSLMDPALWN